MAVGVTILLSFAVFFLLLEDKMPETSDAVPLIGKYFACTIVEASLAVFAACMVLCFHHHEPTDIPRWMRVRFSSILYLIYDNKVNSTSLDLLADPILYRIIYLSIIVPTYLSNYNSLYRTSIMVSSFELPATLLREDFNLKTSVAQMNAKKELWS